MMTQLPIYIFGEVLFDYFPNGEVVLGGAPFNVAWHLTALGSNAHLLSAVGKDELGHKLSSHMQSWGMHTQGIITNEYPTGRVNVQIEQGEPNYEIVMPSAWDAINIPNQLDEGFIYHGSLAMRSEHNRSVLDKLLSSSSSQRFVDINLRYPWWRKYDVLQLITNADIVKMNSVEFVELGFMHDDLVSSMKAIKQHFNIRQLLVTEGESGATLVNEHNRVFRVKPERDIDVVDTVGAGDAFSAMFIFGTLSGWRPEHIMQQAQNLASLVVNNRGGVLLDYSLYTTFIHS
jgi:fructokinase